MIDDGYTNGSGGANDAGDTEVHDDGRDEIGKIEESPDEINQAKEEEGEYEVITGMQEQEEDYEPSDNVWTAHISFAQNTITVAHMGRRRLPPWWVLLDNFSAAHIFRNADLVTNI